MKHHQAHRTLGRDRDQREALMRHLAESLIKHGKIKTTEAKAKEVRPFVEKLVTMSRKGTVSSRRIVVARLGGEVAAEKLVKEIAPKYTDRPGGYTRITKLAPRSGDNAKMAVIEFV
ncbi:MAG: 50S ribosomal protein L17 [bacterium]|nr:50S ribosomal protein L17 [bacterium]